MHNADGGERPWRRTPIAEIVEVRGEGGVYARMRLSGGWSRWTGNPCSASSGTRATLMTLRWGFPLEGVLLAEGVPEAPSPSITFSVDPFRWAGRTYTRLDWLIFNRASSCA
jgi:hypothetical protein